MRKEQQQLQPQPTYSSFSPPPTTDTNCPLLITFSCFSVAARLFCAQKWHTSLAVTKCVCMFVVGCFLFYLFVCLFGKQCGRYCSMADNGRPVETELNSEICPFCLLCWAWLWLWRKDCETLSTHQLEWWMVIHLESQKLAASWKEEEHCIGHGTSSSVPFRFHLFRCRRRLGVA